MAALAAHPHRQRRRCDQLALGDREPEPLAASRASPRACDSSCSSRTAAPARGAQPLDRGDSASDRLVLDVEDAVDVEQQRMRAHPIMLAALRDVDQASRQRHRLPSQAFSASEASSESAREALERLARLVEPLPDR